MNADAFLDICSRDTTRFNLMKPAVYEFRGEAWTGATDGYRALMVRGVFPLALVQAEPPDLVAVVPKVLTGVRADRGALRAWAGEVPPARPCGCGGTKKVTCTECDGAKRSHHFCDCDYCEVDWDACDACKGTGTEECDCVPPRSPLAPGVLGGRGVDRFLVASLLDAAPAGPVLVHVDAEGFSPVALHGEGWLALVMPLRIDAPDLDKAPAFPLVATP